jgi:FAD-linked sulfhydryl oxidase
MARRQHLTLMVVLTVLALLSLSYLFSSSEDHQPEVLVNKHAPTSSKSDGQADLGSIPDGILKGGSIAPKLENATAKYAAAFDHQFMVSQLTLN